MFSDNSLWGLLNFRGYLIKALKNDGYEIVIVAPYDNALIATENISYFHEPIKLNRSSLSPIADFKYVINLLTLIKKHKPSIVISYTIKPNIFGAMLCKTLGIKCICVVTGLGYIFQGQSNIKKLLRRIYVKALKMSDFNFILNDENLKTLCRHGYNLKNYKILSGGEGVNIRKIVPEIVKPNKQITFVMVARVLYDKGYAEFVAAAKANKMAQFILIGALDSNPNAVSAEIVKNDTSIIYLGFLSKNETLSWMRKADCVVLPSYHEGMSVTLMEACSLGKPIICSDIPGCREMLIPNVNGFTVKPKDSKAFSDACNEFISLPKETRDLMGQASRKLAESKLDIDIVYNEYYKVIDLLTKN